MFRNGSIACREHAPIPLLKQHLRQAQAIRDEQAQPTFGLGDLHRPRRAGEFMHVHANAFSAVQM